MGSLQGCWGKFWFGVIMFYTLGPIRVMVAEVIVRRCKNRVRMLLRSLDKPFARTPLLNFKLAVRTMPVPHSLRPFWWKAVLKLIQVQAWEAKLKFSQPPSLRYVITFCISTHQQPAQPSNPLQQKHNGQWLQCSVWLADRHRNASGNHLMSPRGDVGVGAFGSAFANTTTRAADYGPRGLISSTQNHEALSFY